MGPIFRALPTRILGNSKACVGPPGFFGNTKVNCLENVPLGPPGFKKLSMALIYAIYPDHSCYVHNLV